LLTLRYKVESAVFVGTGDRIAAIAPRKPMAGSVPNGLVLFDATSGKVVKQSQQPVRLSGLAAPADRKLIAIAGADQVIRVLEAETLEERIDFRAHDAEISALAFHPQRPWLASASSDGSVKLWDYQTAKLQHTFLGFDGMPVMLAFSPNGRLLAVEAQERTSRLFDLSGESPPAAMKPAVRAPFPVVGQDWLALIPALTDDDLIDEGNGWQRKNDTLLSPNHGPAVLPLPVSLAGKSYQTEIHFRQLQEKDVFHVILPVGDRMVGFDLDGAAFLGYYTGLVRVDGQWGKSLPGALHGKIIKDGEPHVLSISVRLQDTAVTISVTLDSRPLYEWSGPQISLDAMPFWPCPPGRLAIGTMSADWAVSMLRVRQL
jgi:WD40 repeat protein